ncbi:MAG: calcium-binding protein [Alphaproteobacteria bacterium]|nr:calcium-binding protein [Alphaproteobacteria bacterium]
MSEASVSVTPSVAIAPLSKGSTAASAENNLNSIDVKSLQVTPYEADVSEINVSNINSDVIMVQKPVCQVVTVKSTHDQAIAVDGFSLKNDGAVLSADGKDLIVKYPDGGVIVVEGYFADAGTSTPANLVADDGVIEGTQIVSSLSDEQLAQLAPAAGGDIGTGGSAPVALDSFAPSSGVPNIGGGVASAGGGAGFSGPDIEGIESGGKVQIDPLSAGTRFNTGFDVNLDDDGDPIAQVPSIILNPEPIVGDEDTGIPLGFSVHLNDSDGGNETLTVIIGNVPTGASLSAGVDNHDGTWTLTQGELSGLAITPPDDSADDFQLTIKAIATEANGSTASTSEALPVEVIAVADAPDLTVSNAFGDEDVAIDLDIDATLTDTDGSETLSIIVSGVPVGAMLNRGMQNQDGTWTLTQGELSGLAITPPEDSADDFTLTVKVTSTEASNGDMASETNSFDVHVNPVADIPTLIVETTASGMARNAGDQTIDGTNGSDTLYGGSGDDVISGLGGNDFLYGDGRNGTADVEIDFKKAIANDIDFSEDIAGIIVWGIPAGATVSHGITVNGYWIITDPADIATILGTATNVPGVGTVYSGGTVNPIITFAEGTSGSFTLNADVVMKDHDTETPVIDWAISNGISIDVSVDNGNSHGNGPGDDIIHGGAGNDVIYGGAGNGSASGNDKLYGGDGDDRLYGEDGNDKLYFSYDYRVANGSVAINSCSGLAFNYSSLLASYDLYDGGADTDILFGTNIVSHGDAILYRDAQTGQQLIRNVETIVAKNGNDFVNLDGADEAFTVRGGNGNDTIWGGNLADKLYGDSGDDTIYGGAGDDEIYGGTGNDTLVGCDGEDTIKGEDGEDTIKGGLGGDNLSGGKGNDTIWGGAGNDKIDGGEGYDVAAYSGAVGDFCFSYDFATNEWIVEDKIGDEGVDRLSNIERLTFNDYSFELPEINSSTIVENGSNNYIWGDCDPNTIFGLGGRDTLHGGGDNDYIFGGSGNDSGLLAKGVFGGCGNDFLFGGAGSDFIKGSSGEDALFGENGNDSLYGGSENDYLNGGLGDDWLGGGCGEDILNGAYGDDVLFGGCCDDTLIGGAGNDSMFGGTGFDEFVFTSLDTQAGYEVDTIFDFTAVGNDQDTINLDAVFDALGVANVDRENHVEVTGGWGTQYVVTVYDNAADHSFSHETFNIAIQSNVFGNVDEIKNNIDFGVL